MTKKAKITVVSLTSILLVIVYYIGGRILKEPERLPIYNPADINPELVDSSLRRIGRNFTTGDFTAVNHLGDTITSKTLAGKIRVVNFFFTTCPSICIDMTRELKSVQEAYKDNPHIIILSHTVTPAIDSVPVLRRYAELHGLDSRIWWLLWADEAEIQRLARKVYFAVKSGPSDDDDHGFIHTENVVLVDTKGRLRGFYDGTNPDDIALLNQHISILLRDETPRY
ncbi:SCO family protein [Schleiferia thermophila]|jgi:protein SCO1/2|uniref:SCO family protein n=1 Tax=Schleiferia thermophila TaxID=884107 RepID=UPI0004E789D6|nr:SCO family protein [Schleiferia thermophila]KFD39020.1 cytochrome C oxidase assembly protein [Schleiferia thermophila str. Yellowstone]